MICTVSQLELDRFCSLRTSSSRRSRAAAERTVYIPFQTSKILSPISSFSSSLTPPALQSSSPHSRPGAAVASRAVGSLSAIQSVVRFGCVFCLCYLFVFAVSLVIAYPNAIVIQPSADTLFIQAVHFLC